MWKPLLVGMLRGGMTESKFKIVRSSVKIKFWLGGPVAIDVLRPATCPCCGTAGAPLGQPLGIVGHGVVRRSLLGPLDMSDPFVGRVVFARRFRCKGCRAILLVVPFEVVPRRRYAAPSIAGAMARFGVEGLPAPAVETWARGQVRDGFDGRRWRTLDRWIRSVLEGRLFTRMNLRALEPCASLRAAAGAITRQLAAFSSWTKGLMGALAMDGALMSVSPGSQGNAHPPALSTAGGRPVGA